MQLNINKINKELTGGDPLPQPRPVKKTRFPDNLPKINIAAIRKVGFYRNALKKKSTVFITSLYEINRILEEKANKRELTQEKYDTEVNKLLPKRYYDIKNVFSKVASNELLPYRDNDHKIELKTENSLNYSFLYKQSETELLIIKKYFYKNLFKGFIILNQAFFTLLIFFIKKPNSGLRFYVDFRKLNALTKKDRYPLSLIDEALNRFKKIKIFTKLDIRQAFHRIKINLKIKDLTTFRTKYGTYKYKILPFGLTNRPAIF